MDAEELVRKHGSKIDRLFDTVASVDVFQRQFGAELTSWELKFQREFSERKTSISSTYKGFVHHTKTPLTILLTPSPWMLEGIFVYFTHEADIPPDGAFIRVKGSSIALPYLLQRNQGVVKTIHAQEFEQQELDMTSEITTPPRLKELSALLFEHVGMPNVSKKIFSHLYVSSPPIFESIGGLTTGVQAIASRKQMKRLFTFMRQVLPPSFRTSKKAHQRIHGVHVRIPRKWRMESGSLKSSKLKSVCVKRTDPAGFQEVSIAALTNSSTGAMPDIPLAISTEDFWIESGNPAEYRLPILKAAITYQLLSPRVTQRSINAGLSHVEERLELLRNSFGLESNSLARGHILDADVLGRPLSAVKLARSVARASWKPKITSSDIKKAWNSILEPALKEYIEIAEIKEDATSRWGRDVRLENYDSRILRALQKIDSGKKGTPGPTLEEISQEAGVAPHKVAQTLQRMKDDGVIYEPRLGHYRLV